MAVQSHMSWQNMKLSACLHTVRDLVRVQL